MKSLNFFRFVFVFLAFSVFFTSCGDDTNIIDTDQDPKLELLVSDSTVASDVTLKVGAAFTVELTGTKTDNDLRTITIQEAGVNIPISSNRLSLNINSNPILLLGSDVNAFTLRFAISAHSDVSTKTYSFILEDTKGNKTTKSFAITTVALTAIDPILKGVLLNQGGPVGTGGLDLDTGIGTGSMDASAELRDEGINNADPSVNWLQQISGVNGTEVRYIKKGANGIAENFSFDAINFKEEISGLWSNGTAFTATIGTRSVSNKVVKGDIFIAKKGSNYYLLNVVDITETNNDNTDNYKFDIKK
jgi:hypothetical protein